MTARSFPAMPGEIFASGWRNRHLIAQLIRREIVGRYRGSIFGLLWSLFNPLLMLLIYTFVFSVVFNARWAQGSESRTGFAMVLFAGLLGFNLFAECIGRAPALILANVNYVKKVVFPLEILPWVALGSALFHFLVGLIVWMVFYLLFFGLPQTTALLLPVAILPLVLLTLGLSWFLASLGVYLRDVSQVIGIVLTMLMFLSPVFYPLSAIPSDFQALLVLNPLTLAIEHVRDVLVWGKLPDAAEYLVYLVGCALMSLFGFAWFQKTRKGFADVL